MLKAGDQIERLWVAACQRGFNSRPRRSVGAGKERFAAAFGFRPQIMQFNVAQHSRLDAREREEKPWIEVGNRRGVGGLGPRSLAGQMQLGLDLRESKRYCLRVAMQGESVDP